jgi:NUDIX domain
LRRRLPEAADRVSTAFKTLIRLRRIRVAPSVPTAWAHIAMLATGSLDAKGKKYTPTSAAPQATEAAGRDTNLSGQLYRRQAASSCPFPPAAEDDRSPDRPAPDVDDRAACTLFIARSSSAAGGARPGDRPGVASSPRMLAPAGGHVEINETAAQCGIREAMEETGLDVTLVPGPACPL